MINRAVRTRGILKIVSAIAFLLAHGYAYLLALYLMFLRDVVTACLLAVAVLGSIALAYVLGRLRLSSVWFTVVLVLPIIISLAEFGYVVAATLVMPTEQTPPLSIITVPIATTITCALIYRRTYVRHAI